MASDNGKTDATTFNETNSDSLSVNRLLESLSRVTLATFGGGLVGLALDRRDQPTPRSRGGPPMLKAKTNLPKAWSLSCMMFAMVLESSRLSSPTSLLVPFTTNNSTFTDQITQRSIISIGDYTIGGVVAGLSGAMARRPQLAGSKPLLVWGIGMGFGLGLVAGVFQAAVDVGELYLIQQQQEEERQQQETRRANSSS